MELLRRAVGAARLDLERALDPGISRWDRSRLFAKTVAAFQAIYVAIEELTRVMRRAD